MFLGFFWRGKAFVRQEVHLTDAAHALWQVHKNSSGRLLQATAPHTPAPRPHLGLGDTAKGNNLHICNCQSLCAPKLAAAEGWNLGRLLVWQNHHIEGVTQGFSFTDWKWCSLQKNNLWSFSWCQAKPNPATLTQTCPWTDHLEACVCEGMCLGTHALGIHTSPTIDSFSVFKPSPQEKGFWGSSCSWKQTWASVQDTGFEVNWHLSDWCPIFTNRFSKFTKEKKRKRQSWLQMYLIQVLTNILFLHSCKIHI